MAETRPAKTDYGEPPMVARDAFNVWIAAYMMASRKHGTVYIGVTSQLPARTFQHRQGQGRSFTSRYGVNRLVWYETHETMETAIRREKQLKKYMREWKANSDRAGQSELGRPISHLVRPDRL